ncbi:MAG: STAS domain-containing protein [Chloroflexaceae bacterium]|nr:STAS domain-containing protein [Chloroflexaceae bacterium]
MDMKTYVTEGIHILEINGRFDASTVQPVATWLERTTSTPGARVLVNLTDTTFVDSTALATLVQALKRCQQMQGDLHLCGMRRPVHMIFELTRLDKAFNIFSDKEGALQAFAK